MTSISFSDAFLIFGKWRDNESQLQIRVSKPGKLAATPPGRILTCSPNEEKISLSIVVDRQNAIWDLPLAGASFQYGEPADSAVFPEFAERKWSSYLLAELTDGSSVLFAARSEWIEE